jgi:thiamine-phosphate pyrophosphorylase
MKLELPLIYPITDVRLSRLTHAEQVKRLIAGGASFIQLREKHANPRDFYDEAAEAIRIAKPHGAKIIINDRVDIALTLKADGVHLGQDDMPPQEARKILGDDAIIGFSTHTFAQARAALDYPVDYIAFGPIFASNTKEDTATVQGLSRLREVRRMVGDLPLVAIGGINENNMRFVIECGAASVAMIGAVLSKAENIDTIFKKMLRRIGNSYLCCALLKIVLLSAARNDIIFTDGLLPTAIAVLA